MRRDLLILLGVVAAGLILPAAVGNDYYLTIMVMVTLNAMVVNGLVLLMGYAGQVSIGHAAFYGLGAYLTGILTTRYRWPIPAGILAALILTALVAWVVGKPALRLKGHYLAMATLAIGEIIHIAFNELDFLTGGPSGLSGIPRLALAGISFDSDRRFYFLCLGVLALVLLSSLNIIHSRPGRGLLAIHGSERAAQAMGVDTAAFKTAVFVISAVYAALAGALYAHFITFISPSSFGVGASVLLVTMVAIGGMESVWGGLVGAAVLTILPEYLRVFRDYDILIYGAILMTIMIFMPRGLVIGLPEGVLHLFRRAGRRVASP